MAKGPRVQELIGKLPEQARLLELGAFCGFSSILLASKLGFHDVETLIRHKPCPGLN